MRILISVDMEGIAGITHTVQCRRDSSEFARSCALMAEETRAACVGAFEAGATEVLVNDSHGDMRNIEPELLPPDVRLIRGAVKPMLMVQGIDRSIAGVVYIGYHAPAATTAGILDHSYFGAHVHEMLLNGEPCGEARLNSAVAGELGVPAIFISGDQATCADATRFMPWIVTATVKEALGRTSAISLSPAHARSAINTGVRRAVTDLSQGTMLPYTLSIPITLDITLVGSEKADVASMVPGVERVSATSVRYVAPTAMDIFKGAMTIMRVAASLG